MKKVFMITFIILIIFVGVLAAFTYPIPPDRMTATVTYDELYLINKMMSHNIQLLEQNRIIITEEELNGLMAQQIQSQLSAQLPRYFELEFVELDLLEGQVLLNAYGHVQVFPVRLQLLFKPIYSNNTLHAIVEDVQFSRLSVPTVIYSRFVPTATPNGLELEQEAHLIEIPLPNTEMINISHLEFEEGRVIVYYQFNPEQIITRFFNRFVPTF